MAAKGWLVTEAGRHTTNARIPGEGLRRVYVIPPEFMSGNAISDGNTENTGNEL